MFHVGTRDTYDYTAFLDRLAEGLGLPQPVYRAERNDTAAYQAVLPGRGEIPEDFQLSVKAALNYLSEGACKQARRHLTAGPLLIRIPSRCRQSYSRFSSCITPLIMMPGTQPDKKSRSCSSVTVRAAP